MMSISVYVILPTGIIETLQITSSLNVHFLKSTIERNYGIPHELQKILFNGVALDDRDVLDSVGVKDGSQVSVDVDVWWTRLVGLCLKGNNPTLYRRVSVAMQHTDESNRVFISLFISATRGFVLNLTNLLSNYTAYDLKLATKVTGRTLLHAAVGSGSLECLAAIKKHAGLTFERLLYVEDRRGTNAIDELTTRNENMIHYINKFISVPLTPHEVERKNREALGFTCGKAPGPLQKDNKGEDHDIKHKGSHLGNTEIATAGKIQLTTSVTSSSESNVKTEAMTKLSRPKHKQSYENLPKGKSVNTETTKRCPSSTATSEEDVHNLDVQVNKRILEHVENFHLPKIMNHTDAKKGSPHSPRLRSNTVSPDLPQRGVHTPADSQSSPIRRNMSSDNFRAPRFDRAPTPTPPGTENKKKPVAGILKDTNLRKFSAARKSHVHHCTANLPLPRSPSIQRAKSVEHVDNLLSVVHQPLERASSAGKVRRISLLQGPTAKSQAPGSVNDKSEESNIDTVPVFTIEEGRIDKPWNKWIEAVSVDVDSQEGKDLLQSPPMERNRKISDIQAAMHDEQHKKSFAEWCLYKEQEKIVQQQKLKEAKNEKERKEIEARYKKHGKTFEQWLKTKQLYLSLLKQQQQEDEKENLKPRKLLKGKTFEDWQKEIEGKERTQLDLKKLEKVKVEEEKVTKERRRKESTAKYQQWLADKERQDIERDLKAFNALVSRKVTDNKPSNSMRRNRSSTMEL